MSAILAVTATPHPWYVFTIKHADILRPKGALTIAATDRVAKAVASMIGAL
jgi:hypothetical protein